MTVFILSEVFAGLIFCHKLSDIGTWSDSTTKMDEWNRLAQYLVQAYMYMSNEKKLVLLAIDDISGKNKC
jgi:hypothetical protein